MFIYLYLYISLFIYIYIFIYIYLYTHTHTLARQVCEVSWCLRSDLLIIFCAAHFKLHLSRANS